MIFRQLFERESCTYTYLLGDENTCEAIIIDPVYDCAERDINLIKELGLKLMFTLDTHVHADHVTGANILRESFGAKVAISKKGLAKNTDIELSDGDILEFGNKKVNVIETPGHTDSCLTYGINFDGKSILFTGDCLLYRGCGRTDFQQGSNERMFKSVREILFSFDDETKIFPGHDYNGNMLSTIREEKKFNKRLNLDISFNQFDEIMKNLKLSPPKKMDVAVPKNLIMGKIDS